MQIVQPFDFGFIGIGRVAVAEHADQAIAFIQSLPIAAGHDPFVIAQRFDLHENAIARPWRQLPIREDAVVRLG